jgi:hypothetical protein
MDTLIDFAFVVAGWLIYGSPSNPRHPALRGTARALTFGGLFVALFKWSFWPDLAFFPIVVSGLWVFLAVTVVLGEYEAGSKCYSLALALGLVALLALSL